MSPDGTYNGYANYQTWNVCLWISNDEGLNLVAKTCSNYDEFKQTMRDICVDPAQRSLGYETPDGTSWSDSAINKFEMQEFWQENFSKSFV